MLHEVSPDEIWIGRLQGDHTLRQLRAATCPADRATIRGVPVGSYPENDAERGRAKDGSDTTGRSIVTPAAVKNITRVKKYKY